MQKVRSSFVLSALFFIAFGIITYLVLNFDVKAIGPENSKIGLSTINKSVFNTLGRNEIWDDITDVLAYLAIFIAGCFGLTGFFQLLKRKSLLKIDSDILLLGLLYIIVVATYALFEVVVINYRPIILDEGLEASFPSSHTMLVVCIMGSAAVLARKNITNSVLRVTSMMLSIAILLVTAIGRLISGVHWFSDITAGFLLSMAFIMFFRGLVYLVDSKKRY